MTNNRAMDKNQILFTLLRSEIGNDNNINIGEISQENMGELYQLSKKQDLAHIVSCALHKVGALGADDISGKFIEKQMLAIYRCELLKTALKEVSAVFENSAIAHMPLKGSVLRSYYPEEWMRTSCDIDVLVHEEDLERAVSVLVEELGYTTNHRTHYHDISLFSPSGVHLELHFSLKEGMDNIDGLLGDVWKYARKSDCKEYLYYQTNEYFVFHHFAHMSYHFIHGGCGVKPFADLYVIQNKLPYDESTVRRFCRQCGIEEFYAHILYVTDVWFGNKPHTDISRQIENYILRGGVYGTLENRVTVAQGKQGGRSRYAMSRIFISYESMKVLYPVLEKHKWMLPFLQIRRWVSLLRRGKLKRGVRELKINQNVSKKKATDMEIFLTKIGL